LGGVGSADSNGDRNGAPAAISPRLAPSPNATGPNCAAAPRTTSRPSGKPVAARPID